MAEATRRRRLARVRTEPWSGCRNAKPATGSGAITNIAISAIFVAGGVATFGGRYRRDVLIALGLAVGVSIVAIRFRRWFIWRDRLAGSVRCACLACLELLVVDRMAQSVDERRSLPDPVRRRLLRRVRRRSRQITPKMWLPRRRDERFIVAAVPAPEPTGYGPREVRWVHAAIEALRDVTIAHAPILWTRRDADTIAVLAALVQTEAFVSPDSPELTSVYSVWRGEFDDPTALRTARALVG